MRIYLVGGAVRDALIGISPKDKDWVVVGAKPASLIEQGYRQVGVDFPVFIHPKTKQEYALARTERKSGRGYKGFICDFSPCVTLEEDLERRDLTINAMAQAENGEIIDPFDGQADIQKKQLRHVSPAFSDDPLRVLRVAQFAARLHHLGFTVAEETLQFMKKMVASGELNTLTPERVWTEWEKSLSSPHPEVFLDVLRECGALAVVLPEINDLFGVPQPEKWHPEIDTGVHTLMVSYQASLLTSDPVIRFAAQLHDLGKGVTPASEWPSHKQHTKTGIPLINALCERLRIPNAFKEAALLVCAEHTNVHNVNKLRPDTVIRLFDRQDCWRKPFRIEQLVIACEADHQGRKGFRDHPYPQAKLLTQLFSLAHQVNVQPIIKLGHKGQAIRDELTRQRIEAITSHMAQHRTTD